MFNLILSDQGAAGDAWKALAVLAQPIGTVATGLLVLAGVMATLKQNARRLLHEQLERRAKERLELLQREYGNFAAACFDFFANNQTKAGIRADEVVIAEGEHELSEDRAKFEEERLIDRREAARERGWAIYANLAGAYARLLLLDDDPVRLHRLGEHFAKVGSIRPHSDDFELIGLRTNLAEFFTAVGAHLDQKYQRDANLACLGRYPERQIHAQPDDFA